MGCCTLQSKGRVHLGDTQEVRADPAARGARARRPAIIAVADSLVSPMSDMRDGAAPYRGRERGNVMPPSDPPNRDAQGGWQGVSVWNACSRSKRGNGIVGLGNIIRWLFKANTKGMSEKATCF